MVRASEEARDESQTRKCVLDHISCFCSSRRSVARLSRRSTRDSIYSHFSSAVEERIFTHRRCVSRGTDQWLCDILPPEEKARESVEGISFPDN